MVLNKKIITQFVMIFSAFFFFNRLYQSAIRKLFAINQYRKALTVVESLKAFSGKG